MIMRKNDKLNIELQDGTISRKSMVGRRRVLKFASGLGTAGVSGFAGCTGITGSSRKDSDGAFTVGIMIPMTGNFSALGSLMRPGYKAWGKIINERGGINGHPIELRFEDNQSSETRTSKIASQFVSDGVSLMINAYATPLTRAAAPIAEQNKIPLIAGAANLEMISKFEYTFGMYPPYSQPGAAALLGKKTPLSKVATWAIDLAWAKIGMQMFHEKLAPKHDLNIVYSDVHSSNIKDFSSLVLKAKNSGAEALVTFNYGSYGIVQTQAVNTSSWEPKFVAQGTTSLDAYQALGQELIQAITAPVFWSRSLTFGMNKEFKQTFKQVAPKEVNADYHSAMAFAMLQEFGAAVETLGDDAADGAKLHDWIVHNTAETILGKSNFNDRGIQIGYEYKQIQWHSKETPFVYPPSMKQENFIHPKKWP
jgi:branched-chain amino acid transport system substrate-binding protein